MHSYEELETRIIQTGICTICGACISACPLYYIQLIDGKPERPKKKAACKNCSVCFDSCYKTSGEICGKGIGRYLRIVSAQWNNRRIGQDGGVVTAILRCAYDMKLIDGAVLTLGDRWMPVPYVAKCTKDFDACAKTKYGISPVLMKLRSAVVEHGLNKLCVVGTPCHIQAVRHLQRVNPEVSSAVTLTIGLFCNENFAYMGILEQIGIIGLKQEEVDKINILNGKLSIYANDRTTMISVSELRKWVLHHCYSCGDYTSELSDISVGSEASPEGWSTVVIRTEKGEKIFSELERTMVRTSSIHSIEHLKEASERKRKRAMKEMVGKV